MGAKSKLKAGQGGNPNRRPPLGTAMARSSGNAGASPPALPEFYKADTPR